MSWSHRSRASARRQGSATRRQGRRRAEDRAAFLVTITGLLAASLDLETPVATIASVALPHEGGWASSTSSRKAARAASPSCTPTPRCRRSRAGSRAAGPRSATTRSAGRA